MKTSILSLIVFGFLLMACQPSTPDPGAIQTAMAQTQYALPTATSTPTSTATLEPTPTLTATITSTPIPTNTLTPTSTSVPSLPAAEVADICAKSYFGCAKILPGQTIKIGMAGPMTGDNAQFGIDIYQGGKIAIFDGKDLMGWQFELIGQDDGGTAQGGADVAKKFAADPTVVAIAGHVFSGSSAAAMRLYEVAGLPMLAPSNTAPTLTQMGSKVYNRINYTDVMQAKFSANYLAKQLNIKRLAILHNGSTYGEGMARSIQVNFAPQGTVVFFDAIESGKIDYTSVLNKISANKPDALYFGGYSEDAAVLVTQMKGLGIEAVFFGCDGIFGSDFINRAGKNAEGAYAVTLAPPESPEKARFDAAYTATFGQAPGQLSPYTWTAYDSVAVLITLIKKVALLSDDGNLYVPRSALVDAVRGLKNYDGLNGIFTCDATGECNASGPTFAVVKDGKWNLIPNQ